jgi:hypothetical protein
LKFNPTLPVIPAIADATARPLAGLSHFCQLRATVPASAGLVVGHLSQ